MIRQEAIRAIFRIWAGRRPGRRRVRAESMGGEMKSDITTSMTNKMMMMMIKMVSRSEPRATSTRTSTLSPPRVRKGRAMLVLLQLVLACSAVSSSIAVPVISDVHHSQDSQDSEIQFGSRRSCTVDDLLPNYALEGDLSSNWDQSQLVSPPFDCTCNTLKASYFCPNLGDEGYPKWVPTKVADGSCKPLPRSSLRRGPFPPGFKVLFYGNSHIRQVIEGIVCAYSHVVTRRRLTLVEEGAIVRDVLVGPELHCRSCENHPNTMMGVLLEYGCVAKRTTHACRCDDDNGVFEFENGAELHYHFAHKEEGKRIKDGLRVHGTQFSDYDAIVANPGNDPRLETSEFLRTAESLRDEDIPLFWLSTYDGEGDVRDWTHAERRRFERSGARFVPVHDMVESLSYLTKGSVEGEFNPHFCMPGPPNEIGILLLKVAWALRASGDRDD